jgi:phosphoglucomutase
VRIFLKDGSRVVCRLSGTGTQGATLRQYVERYQKEKLDADENAMLAPMAQALNDLLELKKRCGRETPDVIT